jgi:hypothetical protein
LLFLPARAARCYRRRAVPVRPDLLRVLAVAVAACGEGAPSSANQPPVAVLVAPVRVVAGDAASLDGSGSSDPDGALVEYRFLFGDGTPQVTGAAPRVAHVFAGPGVYEVALAVRDAHGAEARATAFVAVLPETRCAADEECGEGLFCPRGRCRVCERACGTTAFLCDPGTACIAGCCRLADGGTQ